ncbi:hypothetical protein [Bacillus thuringiensis]|nr:hypothetical protein [Bacillus thuringiensis]
MKKSTNIIAQQLGMFHTDGTPRKKTRKQCYLVVYATTISSTL